MASSDTVAAPKRNRRKFIAVFLTVGLVVAAIAAGAFQLGRTSVDTATPTVSATPSGATTPAIESVPELARPVDAGQAVSGAFTRPQGDRFEGAFARVPLPTGHVISDRDLTAAEDAADGSTLAVSLRTDQIPADLDYRRSVRLLGAGQDGSAVLAQIIRIHPTPDGAVVTVETSPEAAPAIAARAATLTVIADSVSR